MPYFQEVIDLLRQMIQIPSFSREETGTASLIRGFLESYGLQVSVKGNNVLARYAHYDPDRPTLLLVSHHDTVRPNKAYTRDPFIPEIREGRLYGLGSNDAGGPLVALIAAFLHYRDLPSAGYNLVLAAAAEEEISGAGGIERCLPELGELAGAIVGEPTSLRMAVAERGLMVVDAVSTGVAGHAARQEGINALYKALPDLEWIRSWQFPKVSPLLGPVHMQVTVIQAGTQHNVVPAECRFTVDIRMNELYTHQEVFQILQDHLQSEFQARSMRLRATIIEEGHPLIRSGRALGLDAYGSPTMSDKALLPCPALKLGPGDSARSHTADEYIELEEIQTGIQTYIDLLHPLLTNPSFYEDLGKNT